MGKNHAFRGMATVNLWADDLAAARDWYSRLFGVEAYFQRPSSERPAYVEFRIGDDEDEFGIIDRRFAPPAMQPGPGGAILHWHVDDIESTHARLLELGATAYDPITKRGDSGFITASVVDPFGNVIGIMQNPHWAALHASK
jgi:predicted enzyme related to lactoylglutathione lyase